MHALFISTIIKHVLFFLSLQVLKVGLEQVHQEVTALKAISDLKRRSQRLDYLDLSTDGGYEIPQRGPPRACEEKLQSRHILNRVKVLENTVYEDVDDKPPKRGLGARPKVNVSLETRKGYLKMK